MPDARSISSYDLTYRLKSALAMRVSPMDDSAEKAARRGLASKRFKFPVAMAGRIQAVDMAYKRRNGATQWQSEGPKSAAFQNDRKKAVFAASEVAALLDDDNVIYQATQIFDALADYTRFQILGALSLSDHSVGELKDVCHVSQSAISHQLRLLRDRGLVTARREGQRSIYSLGDEHVVTLIRVGLEHAGHTFKKA